MISLKFDPEADAIYASVRHVEPGGTRGARELDDCRLVHYDHAGEVVGVEFLAVSEGIDLTDVPYAEDFAEAMRAFGKVHLAA